MIRFSHPHIETPMVLDNSSPLTLCVENPKEYYNLAEELSAIFNGVESGFSFWNDDTQVAPDKFGELIISPFYFEATDKKIISLLYKKLQNNYLSGDFLAEFNLINAKLESFLYDLCSTVSFALDHNPLTIEDALKACAVKPSKTYDTLIEKLVCYINIFIELKSISFFVLVGFKDVLSDEELLQLFKHCELHKVSLFFLESGKLSENVVKCAAEKSLPIFDLTKKWLDEYFAGEAPDFTPPIVFGEFSDFRKRVWKILLKIPYGKTATYGEIAKRIEAETNKRVSAQAVGGAVGHNPISIIVPCHRVIGCNGDLTGYAGGLDKKVKLLRIEGVL